MSKSVITIDPIHPGEILSEEFLAPLGLSATAFAKRLGVPANRITRIIAGNTAITADTALLLSAAFDTSAEFWLNLQTRYDLETARRDAANVAKVKAIQIIAAE